MDDGDAIVYKFQGQGNIGWSLRRVVEAISYGGHGIQDVSGNAIIQVDLTEVNFPPSGRAAGQPRRLMNEVLENVVEVVEIPQSDSVAQSFIGVRADTTSVAVSERTSDEGAQLVVTVGRERN